MLDPPTQSWQQDNALDVPPQVPVESTQPGGPAPLETNPDALNHEDVAREPGSFVRRLIEQRDFGWQQALVRLEAQRSGGWTVYNMFLRDPSLIIRSDLVEVEEPPQPVTPPELLAAPQSVDSPVWSEPDARVWP